ncbi:ferritin [Nakamurella antarctica]|uniref:Ferritin n=1 Tax=Nakamurella antarctica TaxID=1902245 RepID=A0A3G8ZMQ0_9ACTN|nr:ferritin [Nakamurella antarctica]AZI58077.1 ferritin [Nakamurella antarctica]
MTHASDTSPTAGKFYHLLSDQVRNEFTASQQYIAIAVWFDSHDLPELASHFYAQSVEERNHAMMLVQWMLDRDMPVVIPSVGEVINEFANIVEPIQLALSQEHAVTEQIKALFGAARAEFDYLGEQFMLWFLKEQVEEIASITTLLTIAQRAGDDWFDVETYLARESLNASVPDADAPSAAGGAL